jgi:zinc protease
MFSPSEASDKLRSCLRCLDLPNSRSVLANGLRVITCRLSGCRRVGVNVCYHVGSRAEEPGKAGLAHLVEHLMYAGTEHHPQSYILGLEQAGATTINANATEDYSTYFETVPTGALDLVLWMEAERMSCLLGALDQDKLDREREVIRNEILEREGAPFGDIKRLIRQHTYPAGHPYRHVALGSLEGLDAVTLTDVTRWLTCFYGTANALVVVAGDVVPDLVLARIEHFFGGIAARAAPPHPQRWAAPLAERKTYVVHHARAKSRLYKVWNTPEWSHPDHALLEVAAHMLAGGTRSILHEQLVRAQELATQIGFELSENELGSQLIVYADLRSDTEATGMRASEAIDQEITRFLRNTPSLEQLDPVRLALVSRTLKALERLTGPNSLTQALAVSELLANSPAFYRERLERIANADPKVILTSAARWLGDGFLTLELRPSGEHKPQSAPAVSSCSAPPTASSRVEHESFARTAPCDPAPALARAATDAGSPTLRLIKLKNGLTVLLIERTLSALTHVRLVIRGAMRAEQAWRPQSRGLLGMTVAMLGRGTKARSAAQIEAQLAALGAEFSSRTGLDTATLELTVLNPNLSSALELLAEIALQPAFDADEFRRLKRRRLAEIEREKAHPFELALREIPRLLYGDTHPYGQPLSGLGYPARLEALELGQSVHFYQQWAQPSLATLVVVGNVPVSPLVSSIEGIFGTWTSGASAPSGIPVQADTPVEPAQRGFISAINRPGQQQSAISLGWLIPQLSVTEEAAWLLARALAADMLSSRLNQCLRGQMGCSYGVQSLAAQASSGGLYIIHTSVRAEMTGAAAHQIRRVLDELCVEGTVTEADAARARTYIGAKLTALVETGAQAADAAEKIASRELSPNYYSELLTQVQLAGPRDIVHAAQSMLTPDAAAWLIAADTNIVGKQLRELGSEIRMLDVNGTPADS